MSLLRNLSGRVAASALLALFATSLAHAQTAVTVLNETFAGGSTINSSPIAPAVPSINAVAHQIVSGNTYLAGTPELVAPAGGQPGKLRLGTGATNTYVETQFLFTQKAVKLAFGEYIELRVTFTAETALLDDNSSGIFLGLFNSSSVAPNPWNQLIDPVQTQPVAGGKQNTTATAGNASLWRGHVAKIFGFTPTSNGQYRLFGKAANTGTTNQEVFGPASSQFSNSGLNSTITPLTPGNQYTAVFRMAILNTAADPRGTGTVAIYAGANPAPDATPIGTAGIAATGTAQSSGNRQTAVYDAISIGFKTSSSLAASSKSMAINSIKIVTTGKTVIVPEISTQPQSQIVSFEDPDITFSVAAAGGGDVGSELSYQWRKDGFPINGATASTYTIPGLVQYADAGTYTVVVTNTAGSTTSTNAVLTVNPKAPPQINTQPASQTITSGNPVTFTVAATGSGLSYKWQKSTDGVNFTDIAGATAASYTIARAQTSSVGQYRVIVTNSTAAVESNAATLTLNYVFTGVAPSGYAASATGGGSATSVEVTTAADFKTQAESANAAVITVKGTLNLGGKVSVKSNKTIQGIDGEATIIGNLELASGVSNVIIRGLNVTNPAGNGITITGASNVYLNHISFYDASDTLLSITGGADNITVSWNEFYYTTANLTGNKATVVGIAGETKPISVTFDNNWWSNNTASHMPETTYGRVHMYNNLFMNEAGSQMNNTTGTVVHANAHLFAERNQYTSVTAPLTKEAATIGTVRTIGNVYTSSFGTEPYGGGDFVNFTPPYAYTMVSAGSLPFTVPAGAGNVAGASSITPTTTVAPTITSTATTVPLGGSFTLTAVTTNLTVAATTPYQWRLSGTPIGAASADPTLNIGGATGSNTGNYTVAVTLASGETVVSAPITITTTSGSSLVPASNSEAAGGGGSPSFWFMGALAFLTGLRRFLRK